MADVDPTSSEGQQQTAEHPSTIAGKSQPPSNGVSLVDQPRFGTPRPSQDQVYIVCRTQYPTQPPIPPVVRQALIHPQAISAAHQGNGVDYFFTFDQMQTPWITIEWVGPNPDRALEELIRVVDHWSNGPSLPMYMRHGRQCTMYRNGGWGRRDLIGKAWVAGPFPILRG
jgi:hypothetical protein